MWRKGEGKRPRGTLSAGILGKSLRLAEQWPWRQQPLLIPNGRNYVARDCGTIAARQLAAGALIDAGLLRRSNSIRRSNALDRI